MAYSEDDKAVALAALEANRGSIKRTSKYTKVAQATLRKWRDAASGATNGEGVAVSEEKRDLKKADLSDLLETLARNIVGSITDDDLSDAPLKDRMTAAGIAVDKMQLLRSKPTAIVDEYRDLPDAELDRRIKALEARKTPAA